MQLVLFDIDGTLTQSNQLDSWAFLATLEDLFGFTGISTDWLAYSHVTDACIFREICEQQWGRSPTAAELATVQQRLLERLAAGDRVEPVVGAAEILAGLMASPNHAVAYAGGAWTASALFKLRAAGLPIESIPFAFSDQAESRVGIMAVALARAEQYYGHKFSSLVYVGDGVWDIRSARQLSYGFIGLATGEAAAALRAEGATWIFPDYRDIEQFGAALTALAG
jgi:phosphoglycolate phosphatase-like HAD superfamily hydrolase